MSLATRVSERGFEIVENVVHRRAVESYRAVLEQRAPQAGVRDLFAAVPETRALVDEANLPGLLTSIVGAEARIVRAILFDKSRAANWRVPWHQDLFVATSRRAEVSGFSSWTVKDGVPHARAPRAVLERMLAVRIHIDDNDETNGPLRVLAGTHRHGVLGSEDIAKLASDVRPTTCIAPSGSALIMRPLLLHASSPASSSRHRRILHLEIADCGLPSPLEWHWAAPLRESLETRR